MEFEKMLRDFFLGRREMILRKFKRVLPWGEYLSDRWEKAAFLGFGHGSSIYDSALVYGDVQVGRNVWIGPFTILDGSGALLKIGDNSHVAAGAQIYTHDTVDLVLGRGEIAQAPVTIGRNCYLGPNCVVVKGVTIGDYVVVGANSLVNRDVPHHSKGFGNPFRVIGKSR